MAQYHQIYTIVPQPSYSPKPYKMMGIQMQWGYGRLVLHLLNNLMMLWENMSGDDFPPFANWRTSLSEEVLLNIYSCDPTIGYHSNSVTVLADTDDISNLPNNDGITVVNFTQEFPTYCFMSLNGLECAERSFPSLEPISAANYAGCYFPDFRTDANLELILRLVERLEKYPVMAAKEVDCWFGYLGLSESARF